MAVKVSVIIVNHNWDKLFKNTINSICNKGRTFVTMELIVINNGLCGDMASKVDKWLKGKPVRLLQIQEANPSRARNIGAKVARGKYLLFLDNDTKLGEGLDRVVSYLDKHSRVGAGQLKLLRTGESKFDSAGEMVSRNGFLVERAREAKDEGQFDHDDLIFSGKGAGMVVRRDVFEKVGGFDEAYVYYWEEPDLFWRVWKSGYEVRFLYMGVVEHAYGTKLKPIPKETAVRQTYLACRNQVMTVYKNGVGWIRVKMLIRIGLCWLGLELLFLVRGKWRHVWAIERATFWWIGNVFKLIRKRRWIKKNLKSDDKWMERVLVKRGVGWYAGKAFAYISGRPF